MNRFLKMPWLLFAFGVTLVSCNNDDDDDTEPNTDTTTTYTESGEEVLNTSRFSSYSQSVDFKLVDCELSDGSSSKCYEVTYSNSPKEWGPGCPSTVTDDEYGVGFYDHDETVDPILYALNADLWDIFEADGYNIIDEDGNVNVVIPSGPPGGGGGGPMMMQKIAALEGSCLDADLDEDLEITYLIPAYPSKQSTSTSTSNFEYWGISLDGFPLAPAPPATVTGDGAAIPALDPCGGHPQPSGPFHWHLVPQEANNVFAANGISDVTCTAISQSSTSVIGYAQDGYAIYGSKDYDGSTPTDLDECNGHFGATEDHPDGIYHYHISSSDAPNILPCLYGATVKDNGFASYE